MLVLIALIVAVVPLPYLLLRISVDIFSGARVGQDADADAGADTVDDHDVDHMGHGGIQNYLGDFRAP